MRQPRLPVWTEDSDPSYGVTYYPDHIKAEREHKEAEKVEVPASDIVVAEELVAADPRIEQTEKSLSAARPDDDGLLSPRARTALDVYVSPDSIGRAMRIMDALLKAFASRQLTVATGGDESRRETTVTVDEEAIAFRLVEMTQKVEREPTAQERRDMEFWGKDKQFFRRVPSGRLCLEITSGLGVGRRRRWVDDRRRKLDVQLNSVMAAFYIAAADNKEARKRAEEMERQRKEAERLKFEWHQNRYKKMEEIKAEQAKLDALLAEAAAWQQAQRIRGYVQAKRDAAIRKDGEVLVDSDLARWIEWSLGHANRIDPLAEGPPSILDERQKWERNPYSPWG